MIQLDTQTEHEIIELANRCGESANMFLKRLLTQYKTPNAETIAAMKEAESGNLKRYTSIDELFNELEKNGKR